MAPPGAEPQTLKDLFGEDLDEEVDYESDTAHLLAYTTITGIRYGSKCLRIGALAILSFNIVNALTAFSDGYGLQDLNAPYFGV